MSISCQLSCHCFPCSQLGNTIEDSIGLIVYIVFFCTLKANQYKLSFKVSNYWISPCQISQTYGGYSNTGLLSSSQGKPGEMVIACNFWGNTV